MSDRTCELCKKVFTLPYLLKKHKSRITPCVKESSHFKCACGKQYTKQPTLSKHKKTCTFEEDEIKRKEEEECKKKNDIEFLKDEIEKLKQNQKETQSIMINSTNNSNNTITTNNITINAWNSPDFLRLDFEKIKHETDNSDFLQRIQERNMYNPLIEMTGNRNIKEHSMLALQLLVSFAMQFAYEKPEYKNIYINKTRTDYCDVLIENEAKKKWNMITFDEASYKLVNEVIRQYYLSGDFILMCSCAASKLNEIERISCCKKQIHSQLLSLGSREG